MPTGTTVSILADRTQTIRASVHDVEVTLIISIALVVMVVYFALGRITPTLAACQAGRIGRLTGFLRRRG